MAEHRRARIIGYGIFAAVLAVIVSALALGGNHGSNESAGGAGSTSTAGSHNAPSRTSTFGVGAGAPAVPVPAATAAPSGATGVQGSTQEGLTVQTAADAVTATRVVKTGRLDLRVSRGQVQSTVTKLVSLTTSLGGYVSQSSTETIAGEPAGQLTLRIPVASFDNAVIAAEKLGHVESLTTNAHDVTGKVVDLGARITALRQTRATYLTILGRARTIGATLEVQQRVEDVQSQIDELQGELNVLRNQSADGTLTVSVDQPTLIAPRHQVHHKGGIGKAWHDSVSRFARGFDAIVGALGPLLLVVLVLAVLAGIATLGYRGVRRATS
ncbi:MAG TPA: DUF4349 domain-containing protein [Mycobacteriales bacterium]|nr:DUF4349 domain-containing protein [Mycobacteriales bacterium]